MQSVVIDASVALGWFLPARTQTETDFCIEVRARIVGMAVPVLAPSVFDLEVAGGLLKARRSKALSLGKFNAARALMLEFPVQIHAFPYNVDQIIELALAYHAQPADAMYLHVAELNDARVVTIDSGMAQACRQSRVEFEFFDRSWVA